MNGSCTAYLQLHADNKIEEGRAWDLKRQTRISPEINEKPRGKSQWKNIVVFQKEKGAATFIFI
jgi:hypothetical protein